MLCRPLSAAVLALLLTAAPAAASASTSRCDGETLRLQRALTAAGYPAGPADGCRGPATTAAVQAFQRAQRLTPDGVVGPATRAALRRPRRVVPVSSWPAAHVEVDLARQILILVRDGRTTAVYAASSGRPGFATPTGSFRVAVQQRRSWSHEYDTWLPWASYFLPARGIAVHGGATPARPDSHGCVRVPLPFAATIYASMPPGTTVTVH